MSGLLSIKLPPVTCLPDTPTVKASSDAKTSLDGWTHYQQNQSQEPGTTDIPPAKEGWADRLGTNESMEMAKISYTFDEAAEMVGYSVRTLKQAVADGNLVARYANSKGVLRHEDLYEWIDSLPAEPPTK